MISYYIFVIKQYANFRGRAKRLEYWSFVFVNLLVAIFFYVADQELIHDQFPVFFSLYNLAILLPSMAVSVRRLHDIGRAGWWLLIMLIPLVGPLVMVTLMALPGQTNDNKYGPG
jgi:uncharacterized membrane protein YhaH (DUF805 family)